MAQNCGRCGTVGHVAVRPTCMCLLGFTAWHDMACHGIGQAGRQAAPIQDDGWIVRIGRVVVRRETCYSRLVRVSAVRRAFH